MCKKLCVLAVAIVAGLVVASKSSLLQVWWKDTRTALEKQVPPETRIKQLRLEIDKIDQELRSAVSKLATQEVSCKTLGEETESLKKKLQSQRQDLVVMIEALDSESTVVNFQGSKMSADDLQAKLDRLRAEFETSKATLKNKEEILKHREEAITAAHQRISKIKEKKGELLSLVEKMETQLELLRLKQVENHIVVDDSQVSKCESLYQDIQRRLQEEDKKAELFAKYGLTSTKESSGKAERTSREESIKAAKALLD